MKTRRLLSAMALATLCTTAHAQTQPNILFIMADDLGWADTSNTLTTMGMPSDFYETPTLDRLAAEGIAFTNAYANPTCAPTRTALLSGAYAPRSTNNVYTVNPQDDDGTSLLVNAAQGTNGNNVALSASTTTHAELLQAAGYTTATVGKFHVTNNEGQILTAHGFDANYGGSTSGGPAAYHADGGVFSNSISATLDPYAGNYTQDYVDNFIKPYATDLASQSAEIDALVGTAKHVTDASVDAAIDFMSANNSDPFFVQFSSYAVHTPVDADQARDDLLAKYETKTPGAVDDNASYAALIEGLDQGVGRLIDYLETTADPDNPGQMLDENTLVIFYSDNGGTRNVANNGPFSGSKGSLYEGGIRVPMVAWSGNEDLVVGGTISDEIVMPIDFYTTFASLAGEALPSDQIVDGIDLSNVFADGDADADRDTVFWHQPVNGSRGDGPMSVVHKRIGETDWKLFYNYEDQSWELYNLDTDIDESDNLAGTELDILEALGLDLINWLDDLDAPLATVRAGTIEIDVEGTYLAYANGEITTYADELVSFSAGEQLPFFMAAPVPEPSSLGLFGVLGLGLLRRRR
jgi:arylsulfatase A-like enzyme